MLPRTSQTNYSSTIQSAETISPLQEYVQSPSSTFSLVEEDNSGKEENNEPSTGKNDGSLKNAHSQSFNALVPSTSFQEIFNNFFVAGHEQLLMIQSMMNQERDNNKDSLLTLSNSNTQNILDLRKHYYQVQMMLYKMPKGRQLDSAL